MTADVVGLTRQVEALMGRIVALEFIVWILSDDNLSALRAHVEARKVVFVQMRPKAGESARIARVLLAMAPYVPRGASPAASLALLADALAAVPKVRATVRDFVDALRADGVTWEDIDAKETPDE